MKRETECQLRGLAMRDSPRGARMCTYRANLDYTGAKKGIVVPVEAIDIDIS